MFNKKLLTALSTVSGIIFICFLFVNCTSSTGSNDLIWKAPADADKLRNPFRNAPAARQKGQALYDVYCWSCHGKTGFGDGAAGKALGQKPANFHDYRVKAETDGALFWKMSNGRGNMPPFKDALSEEQRWQLISYIRHISVTQPPSAPRALRPDITIKHVMTVDSLAVRILHNPVTGELWYTTFDGNVCRIKSLDSTTPVSEKIFTVKDHGITRLQGAVFSGRSIFLCGNVDTNNHRTTRGRMVRFDLQPSGQYQMTVVFNTVNYGANKTIYDHGWNAMEISPDGKYIYVNSGARTDHGEVQDNGGLYPNARDNALTSKIFRFPTDAKDLYLTDDEAKLEADGFLYVKGIRNAYDMAVDAEGNLFAVSNSPDYDMPEDMFWVRQNHHYGFT